MLELQYHAVCFYQLSKENEKSKCKKYTYHPKRTRCDIRKTSVWIRQKTEGIFKSKSRHMTSSMNKHHESVFFFTNQTILVWLKVTTVKRV
jgi:hypothetical protein